jgi:nicotinate-nucleotide adenylyltransferase
MLYNTRYKKGGLMQHSTEFSHIETKYGLPKQNRVGILGGTFNPVHFGHIAIAKIALYEFALGEIVFLPLGLPPHKRNEYIAPPESRLDMIKLAIEEEKRFSVNTIELYRDGFTYSVDTLEILTRENRNTEYYYIIGADSLFELKTWKNFERVFCLTNFICVLRPGQDDMEVKEYAERLNEEYGYKFFVAEDKGPDISSSDIRESAAKGRLKSGLLPEKVLRYIEKKHLYMDKSSDIERI